MPKRTTYLGLLRAVNIGVRQVSMATLRELLATLGMEDVRTLLQSGNVVFRSKEGRATAIESKLEVACHRSFGFEIDIMVRSAAEWRRVIDANPFAEAAASDPGHLVVLTTKTVVPQANVEALQAAIKGPERVRAGQGVVYMTYPEGIGRSKVTNAMVEKHLRTRGTARNWNTVLKLRALADELEQAP